MKQNVKSRLKSSRSDNHLSREKQLCNFNSMLKTINQTTMQIMQDKNPHSILSKVCGSLTRESVYTNAWIGILNQKQKVVDCAYAGFARRYNPVLKQLKAGNFPLCVLTVLKNEFVYTLQHPYSDCTCSWAEKHNDDSTLVVRLEFQEKNYGILYTTAPFGVADNSEARDIMVQFGQSIGFALFALERENEHRQTDEELSKSEEKYRKVIENASDAIFISDLKTGIILEANQKAEHLLGIPVAKIIGMRQKNLHTRKGRKRFGELFGEVGLKGSIFITEDAYVQHQDGRMIPVEISAHRVEIADGKKCFANFRDITERVTLQQQLRQAEKMQAIGQLAGGFAHDFNNRLVAIQGFSQLLRDELKDPELRDYAERVVSSAKKAGILTGQMLTFARKGDFRPKKVNIHELIGEAIVFLKHSIDKRITIEQHLLATREITTGDPGQLQNILLNLAINSRDAMPVGGKLTFTTGNIKLDNKAEEKLLLEVKPGKYLEIEISDTGCGMDEYLQSRIFEPFFTTKKAGKGTGLGLASTYGTLQNHNASVSLYSKKGVGTTFKIYLPLCESGRKRGTESEKAKKEAKILLIDDEKDIRELATVVLKRLGYNVVTHDSAGKALRYYRKYWQSVDLVILDLVMPGLTGKDCFAELKKINPEARILLATGFDINKDTAQMVTRGAQGILSKPFDFALLDKHIAAALA